MAMVSRTCPLCGSADRSQVFAEEAYDPRQLGQFAFASRKLPEYMHYRLMLCARCDLLYASPAPEPKNLAEAYLSAAYDSTLESRYAARTYARIMRQMLGRLCDRAGALDIGAGDGAFLKELQAYGFTEVIGVEPSAAPIDAAEDAVRPLIRHGQFSLQDLQGRQFRLVTCFQTLEHVDDPLRVCRDAYALLKEEGAMMCVVHNRFAWSAKMLGRRSPIYDIEHLQLFSRRSARLLLETAGFRNVRTAVVLNCYPANYWIRLLPLPLRIKKAVIAAAGATGVGRIPAVLPAGNLAVFGFKPTSGVATGRI